MIILIRENIYPFPLIEVSKDKSDMCPLILACPAGRFGEKCAETCHCAEAAPCDVASGYCDNGCSQGWTGSACSQVAETETRGNPLYIDV